MVGILLALQVNNWNEYRKTENERFELIDALVNDFKSTQTRLDASTLLADSLINRVEGFLSVSYKDNQHISIDSLKYCCINNRYRFR